MNTKGLLTAENRKKKGGQGQGVTFHIGTIVY